MSMNVLLFNVQSEELSLSMSLMVGRSLYSWKIQVNLWWSGTSNLASFTRSADPFFIYLD